MQRRTILRLGTGLALGGALAACGGGGHDGGAVEPEPDAAPRPAPVATDTDRRTPGRQAKSGTAARPLPPARGQ